MRLIHRTKILLSVLQELDGRLSDARMQRLLFLYCKEYVKRDEYYEFIGIDGDPYSVQADEDKNGLIRKKLLEKSDGWVLLPTKHRFAAPLDFFEKIAIQDLKNTWQDKSDEELSNHIMTHYADALRPQLLSTDDDITFYTIGYEGLSPEAYINLLTHHKVRMLIDVRRNAFSHKYGFSKSELSSILPRVGIKYLHMPQLGIASEKRQELAADKDYAALFEEYEQTTLREQTAKLTELQTLLEENRRIAITCFEADPHHCHRSHVAKALKARPEFSYKIEHLAG